MKPEDLQHFNAQLTQGIAVLEQLENLLSSEREALSQRELEQIQELSEKKQTLIGQYLELNRQRVELLERLGLEASDAGVQQLINQASPAAQPVLLSSWQKIQDKLESLQSANQINNQVANRNLKNVEQLLSIMSGRQSKDRLYNQKGSAGHYRAQSRLGKA